MKINKLSLAIITAAGLLAVTPAIYAQTSTDSGTNAPAPAHKARRGMMTLESIDKAVTLTDAEKPKVQSALDELNTAMQAARQADDSKAAMQEARKAFNDKIKDILTPDQFTKFQAMRPGAHHAGGAGGATPPPAAPAAPAAGN
jgi:Spy/CpxP family protein refolding chaperone